MFKRTPPQCVLIFTDFPSATLAFSARVELPRIMQPASLPQELQDMVVDGNADDMPTLHQTSQVNHAWRDRSIQYLFSRLVVRAPACHFFVEFVNADGTGDIRAVRDDEDPSKTFEQILSELPHSIDKDVRTLVFSAASLDVRMMYAAQGFRMKKPELDACTVKLYLERFPNVDALVVEDVWWFDCPQEATHCRQLPLLQQRSYRSISLRRISHNVTSSTATFLLQIASSIDLLEIDGVTYSLCDHEPYSFVPVKSFRWGIHKQPWGTIMPSLGHSTLRLLDLAPITSRELGTVRTLLENHRDSLEEFAIRIWSCGNGKSVLYSQRDILTSR